ncbi:MAG: hypothetical protein LKK13_02330 [Bacilli bacterium]|nr:hypothetical protein [Bacilli bacterium]
MGKRKRGFWIAATASLVGLSALLSSCEGLFGIKTVYRVGVDEEHGLRFVQNDENDGFLNVDEYYYDGPSRSGRIAMGIVIPESIEGMPVRVMGRKNVTSTQVYEYPEYEHDDYMSALTDACFIVAARVPFEEGTSFEFDFDIRADLYDIFIDKSGGGFIMNRYARWCAKPPHGVMFDCSFNFSVAEGCRYYYSRGGRLFRRMDDGDEEVPMPKQVYVDFDSYFYLCSEPGQDSSKP